MQSHRYFGFLSAGGLGAGIAMVTLSAADLELHPPKYPWDHSGVFNALDHRRYVCACSWGEEVVYIVRRYVCACS